MIHRIHITLAFNDDGSNENKKGKSEVKKMSEMPEKLRELSGNTPANILEKYYPCPVDSYAIDMSEVMKNIGVSVFSHDFTKVNEKLDAKQEGNGDVIGAIICHEGKLGIFVSNKQSYAEQRSIIAHELGHCCLHSESLITSKIECARKSDRHDPHEIEADNFGDELLMPENRIREVYNKLTVAKDVNLMAEIFCVPIKCMKRRLDSLGLSYC